jgi:hypothetical protein
MGRDRCSRAYFATMFVVALVATGCPDSDVFETGTYEVKLETVAVNDAGWECVLASFPGHTLIEPLDGICPDAATPCFDDTDCGGGECTHALASEDLRANPILASDTNGLADANFSDQGQACAQDPNHTPRDFPLLILSPGLYRITRLELKTMRLFGSDGSSIACEGFDQLVSSIGAYQDQLLFRVGPDEPNAVRFVIDAAKLAEQLLLGGDCINNLQASLPQVFSIQ